MLAVNVLLSVNRIGAALPAKGAAAKASTKLVSADGAKIAVAAVVQPASATATEVPILSEPNSRAVLTPLSAKALKGTMVKAIPAIAMVANVLLVVFFFIFENPPPSFTTSFLSSKQQLSLL